MTDNSTRIEQFRKMANDDPNNALGHFSLGRELLAAERFDEAATSLARVIEIDANISKAYQLLATALLKLDRKTDAIDKLTAGVKIADARGDLMPRNDMTKMLKDLGAPVPEPARPAAAAAVGEGEVHCVRCNQVRAKIAGGQPFRNAQGKEIYDKICGQCWREWIGMGTKVINELRLPMNDPQAQKLFEQHMREFLNLG